MMNKMVVSNLVHRPIRSMISIIAIALEVTLILLIVGLALGMLNDSRQRQAGIGADVVVMPPGSSFIVGLTGAPMSIKIGNILAKLPHVVDVAPVVTSVSTQGTIELIAGIDLNSYEKLAGPFQFVAGGPFKGPDDCLVDDLFARAKHVKVNDKIEILNHSFRVAGIVEPGRGARKFLQLNVMQDLIGAEGKATIFYVKTDDPNNADEVVNEIKAIPGMEHYVATSMAYYLSMMTTSHYPGVSQFIDFVIFISVIIGFLVIFQSMYTAVMERTREIGILKSLGASKFYIVDVILRETLLLAIGGIIVGVLFSLLARVGIDHRTTLRVVVTGSWILKATAIAIVGSVIGAFYPAYKAAQKDPIDALAYE
ncbi:MAG TPA: FtsX-like permease family protein [Verrucomicrobiae bacterium]|jgi:putative ABC transport system permease protein|nr:FtsX-like permease family protein [Verrucomicrobiae bacterium]